MTAMLTARHLTHAGACAEQVTLFRRTFPGGAPLTAASLRTAQTAGLNVFWLGVLLDPPASAEYDRVCALSYSAYAEYERVRGAALAEYDRVCGAARAEYVRVCGAALLIGLRATFRRAAKDEVQP